MTLNPYSGFVRLCLAGMMLSAFAACADNDYKQLLQNGDIIFHTSRSAQSRAIQLATRSEYTHMGIVLISKDDYYVYEAVQPVKVTPLDEWIARGSGNRFTVKRLKDAAQRLSPTVLKKMHRLGESWLGRDYDLYFGWSDDKLYCSEAVWKIYQQAAGVEIGTPAALKSFDLSHPLVKAKMRERYGDNIPWEEPVISPAAMFASPLLETVYAR